MTLNGQGQSFCLIPWIPECIEQITIAHPDSEDVELVSDMASGILISGISLGGFIGPTLRGYVN